METNQNNKQWGIDFSKNFDTKMALRKFQAFLAGQANTNTDQEEEIDNLIIGCSVLGLFVLAVLILLVIVGCRFKRVKLCYLVVSKMF